MDQLHLLILLSFSMLIGSFFSGFIPMAFKMSDSKSRLLALMGSGILVGTALAIIIPEGIDSIYAQPNPVANQQIQVEPASSINFHEPSSSTSNKPTFNPGQAPVETWTIGVSLVAGFVLMLLIDQFSIYQSQDSTSNSYQHDYILASQVDSEELDKVCEDESNRGSDYEIASNSETRAFKEVETTLRVPIRSLLNSSNNNNQYGNGANRSHTTIGQRQLQRGMSTKVTPTLGLVIHASADGIALGAAATTSHRDVEMIIFLAIMLHKAPAAFSLVVFLLHRGLKHSTIRRHLLAFSLSAPISALVTYFGLSQSGKEALRRNNATGIAMLFSAGTFLYVATVHVLPELVHNRLLTPRELLFLVGGAFLPILLAQSI